MAGQRGTLTSFPLFSLRRRASREVHGCYSSCLSRKACQSPVMLLGVSCRPAVCSVKMIVMESNENDRKDMDCGPGRLRLAVDSDVALLFSIRCLEYRRCHSCLEVKRIRPTLARQNTASSLHHTSESRIRKTSPYQLRKQLYHLCPDYAGDETASTPLPRASRRRSNSTAHYVDPPKTEYADKVGDFADDQPLGHGRVCGGSIIQQADPFCLSACSFSYRDVSLRR